MTAQHHVTERRRHRRPPSSPVGYLDELPARVLLDRLRTPMLAVGLDDGVLVYANPACARMLGYPPACTLIGQSLSTLLAGHAHIPPPDCVTSLRAAADDTAITDWCDAGGFPVRTVVSAPLLVRETDPILLVSITDVSELLWNHTPRSAAQGCSSAHSG